MTRPLITMKRLTGVVAGLTLAAAVTALAFEQPSGRRGHRGRGDGPGFGPGPGAMFEELDLSEDQQEQIRALSEQSMVREGIERVMDARKALNDAVDDGADEGAIRQLAYELGQTEADAAVQRARLHSQIQEVLSDEQKTEYRTLLEERKQRMEERRKRFEERQGRSPREERGSF